MTRRLVLVSLLAVAGACGEEGSDYPIGVGGGGGTSGGGSGNPDGGTEVDANTVISGRVCLISDPRSLTSPCANTGADGLTVTLGSETATTAANGAFVITKPTGTKLIWFVSGSGIETTAVPQASGTTIPALASTVYDDMLAATNAVVTGGTGALIARITKNGNGASGITAIPTPQPDSEVYYDGASVTEWELDSTGGAGVVWIPSIGTGTASLALDNGVTQSTVVNIEIYSDTISYVFASAP